MLFNFPHLFITFNYSDWEIFILGPTLQFQF